MFQIYLTSISVSELRLQRVADLLAGQRENEVVAGP